MKNYLSKKRAMTYNFFIFTFVLSLVLFFYIIKNAFAVNYYVGITRGVRSDSILIKANHASIVGSTTQNGCISYLNAFVKRDGRKIIFYKKNTKILFIKVYHGKLLIELNPKPSQESLIKYHGSMCGFNLSKANAGKLVIFIKKHYTK